jgi:alpha-L-fucosidase
MKNRILLQGMLIAATCLAAACSNGPNKKDFEIAKGPFEPTWESLMENNRFPEWFRDAKFGIWAHWGVQCVPEAGDWYARNMYIQGERAYRHHLAAYGHPSEFGFMEFIPMWKADKWDPNALMKLYKKAGAQYFVAMANHHDNFDNYDSKYQEWNSVNLGPKRDIVGEFAEAARNEGLRFGVSNHAAHAWHWFQPAYGYDPEGKKAGVRYDAYNLTKKDGKGKWWEGYDPQEFYTKPVMVPPAGITTIDSMNRWHDKHDRIWSEKIPADNPDFAAKWFLRTKDLIDRYTPDLLYFDDTELPLEQYGLDIAAHYYNSSANRNNGKNDVVVTAKGLTKEHQKGVTLDCERGSIGEASENPWQTCSCIGGWHYDQSTYDRDRYKTVEIIVKTLVDIVSKNGNLLLSIPVKGNGSIDDKESAFLEGMGEWMAVHGEGIYGTRPWKIFGEGVSNTTGEGSFGAREREQASLSARDIRFTAKDGKLYTFVLGFPKTKTIEVVALGFGSPQLEGKKIIGISMLGTDKAIKWQQKADKLIITMPDVEDTGKAIGFVIEGVI